ncbi:MAG TPA: biotin/lipoyl-binding protein, partial [Pseudonocardia sp.]
MSQHRGGNRRSGAGGGAFLALIGLAGRRRNQWLLLLAVALPVVLVAAGCGSAKSEPTAVRVVRGAVARTVSATGTLQAISQQRLGFTRGGKLIALLVSVGQQVSAGQVLARVDDFDAQQDVQQA